MSEWFVTDDDCLQHCRQIRDITPNYDFIQINSYHGNSDGKPFYQIAHGSVRVLSDYSEEEIADALSSFGYSNMDDFVIQNSPGSNFVYKEDGSVDRENSPDYSVNYQLIAEMLFESNNQEFVTDEYADWNEAVMAVSKITGLDLTRFMDKDLFLIAGDPEGKGAVTKFILSSTDCSKDAGDLQIFSGGQQKVSLHEPEIAVSRIAEFLSSAPPTDAPIHIFNDAKSLLPELMQPIIDANIGRDSHTYPMVAIKWGFEHLDYVKDLDAIFNKLGVLEVERHRPSVTQGAVSVLCNGKEIVRYGDDIKLHSTKAHNHEVFSSCYTTEPQYGTVISGWGSVKPDEHFRRAALTQYGKDIVKALTPFTRSLDQIIAAAQSKASTGNIGDGKNNNFER